MAWRHRSRDERILLGIIGFLSFALFCFIIAVTAMDFSYKAQIRKLEDDLNAWKTTSPQAIVSTSQLTELTSDPTSTIIMTTSTDTPPTPTTLSTTDALTTSTTPLPTTSTDQPSSETTDGSTDDPGLLEALQSILLNFSGQLKKKTWEKSIEREGLLTRTRASIAILADIQREESKPVNEESHPLKPSETRNKSLIVPPSGEDNDHTRNETESPPFDYGMSDTEDDYEGIHGKEFPIDDPSHEGSGDGASTP